MVLETSGFSIKKLRHHYSLTVYTTDIVKSRDNSHIVIF